MAERFGAAAAVVSTVLAAILVATDARWTAGFDNLKEGQAVDVDGTLVGDKTIQAQEIEIQHGMAKNHEIAGEIEAIDLNQKTLRIVGTQVVASEQTAVEDQTKTPLEFSSLKVGQRVKAKGRLGDKGVFQAEKIKLGKPQPYGVSIEGPVEKLDEEHKTITVLGFSVTMTPATKITTEKIKTGRP